MSAKVGVLKAQVKALLQKKEKDSHHKALKACQDGLKLIDEEPGTCSNRVVHVALMCSSVSSLLNTRIHPLLTHTYVPIYTCVHVHSLRQ